MSQSLDKLSSSKDTYMLEEDCIVLMPEKSILTLLNKVAKDLKREKEEQDEEDRIHDIHRAIRVLESNNYKIIHPDQIKNNTKDKLVKSK